MKKNAVNWGILSTATIARKQVIPAIHQAENANIIAIASESGKASEVAKQFHIPKTYESYEDLLADPEIDIVYIPLPNGLHSKWVKEAAKHGKHVLCEKPAALTTEETKEMIQVCRENNVLFMEALMYQFHPQHKRVKDIIDSGEIGEVKLMRSSFTFQLEELNGNIRMSKELGGGSLYDIGCYCIHAIRTILDREPVRVYAVEENHPIHHVDMSAVAIMELDNGMKAYFDCGMNMTERNSYEVVGTKGKIEVPRAFIPRVDGEGVIVITTDNGKRREETITDYYYKLGVEHLSNCLLTGIFPIQTPESSISNMKVLEACFQSIRTGATVELLQKVGNI
ncbi:Gfo/Idh/MocA family oxidoreductase [Bacillus sp. FJAT-50079]|uniref:Gfo/Idh/MocA family protein n=1 Tax=Bacillus sp. FJAT-50079 TaxID=2833577 RepID=UPI001BC8EC03|nr:Gfo/Idh/MocA family oxidoreductase [Bacillus sp. FJAT-50079]MBS4208877.1 Gfo/Idh/MocA family oxidoreductase [Bacillus sp. FJAT-50079]